MCQESYIDYTNKRDVRGIALNPCNSSNFSSIPCFVCSVLFFLLTISFPAFFSFSIFFYLFHFKNIWTFLVKHRIYRKRTIWPDNRVVSQSCIFTLWQIFHRFEFVNRWFFFTPSHVLSLVRCYTFGWLPPKCSNCESNLVVRKLKKRKLEEMLPCRYFGRESKG